MKLDFLAPQIGHTQSEGTSSHAVPAGTPLSPFSCSYTCPQSVHFILSAIFSFSFSLLFTIFEFEICCFNNRKFVMIFWDFLWLRSQSSISIDVNLSFPTPHLGHFQSSGMSSNFVSFLIPFLPSP